MSSELKGISILGRKEVIMPFRAVGLETIEVDEKNVRKEIKKSIERSSIIFISEEFVPLIDDIMEKYSEVTLPAIISIPSPGVEKNYAVERLNKLIKKAVGVEIHREE